MSKDNMGIADNDFYKSAIILSDYASELSDKIDDYINIMNFVCNNGIKDQLIRSKLISLTQKMNMIKAPLNEVISVVSGNCKDFVDAVDDTDKFLY